MAALFGGGYYGDAEALFDRRVQDDDPSAEAILLRADIALIRDHVSAFVLLDRLKVRPRSNHFARREAMRGEAYARSGDFEAADHHLKLATRAAQRLRMPDLTAAVAYRIGRRYLIERDPSGARVALRLVGEATSLESQLDALHLESLILREEGDVRGEALGLIKLLALIDPNEVLHAGHRAYAVRALAARARDLWIPDAFPLIELHLGGTPWAEQFPVGHFQTIRALAWAKMLQGDYFNAFRYLRENARTAPSGALQVVSLCDQVVLARALRDERSARQRLAEVREIVDRVDWGSSSDEGIALVLLAELLSPVDPSRAASCLARFRRLRGALPETFPSPEDEPVDIAADECTGLLDVATGRRELARSRSSKALAAYEGNGYEWRAARSALHLFDITDDRRFLRTAEAKLGNYRSSWLNDELHLRITSS